MFFPFWKLLLLRRPLTVSRIRTPKLNTSVLTEKFPCVTYSGAIYPLQHDMSIFNVYRIIMCEIKQQTLLRKNILGSHDPARISMTLVFWEQLRHAKIGYFRIHVFIKQNITSFEVTMNDPKPWIFMQIQHSSSSSSYNVVPHLPVKKCTSDRIYIIRCKLARFTFFYTLLVNRIYIHYQKWSGLGLNSAHIHKQGVFRPLPYRIRAAWPNSDVVVRQKQNFILKLQLSLCWGCRQPFYNNLFSIRKLTLIQFYTSKQSFGRFYV